MTLTNKTLTDNQINDLTDRCLPLATLFMTMNEMEKSDYYNASGDIWEVFLKVARSLYPIYETAVFERRHDGQRFETILTDEGRKFFRDTYADFFESYYSDDISGANDIRKIAYALAAPLRKLVDQFEDESGLIWDVEGPLPISCEDCGALMQYIQSPAVEGHMCGGIQAESAAAARYEDAAYGYDFGY